MSDASKRSHIPDEKLIDLTDRKLEELKAERADLEGQAAAGAGAALAQTELRNKERAADKLEQKRDEMVDGNDHGATASSQPLGPAPTAGPTTPSKQKIQPADAPLGEPGKNEEERLDEALQESMTTSDPVSIKIA